MNKMLMPLALLLLGATIAVLGIVVADNASVAAAAVVCGTGLALISPLLPRLTGQLQFGLSGLSAKLDDVNESLDTLLLLSMSTAAYENLRKLATGRFGSFEKTQGLERELRHLNLHGYIGGGFIHDIPASGVELCDYVKIAEPGRVFVSLREKALAREPRRQGGPG